MQILVSFFLCYWDLLGVLMMEYASCLNFSCKSRDVGFGFWMSGCFPGFGSILLLFLLFVLGLKVLHLGFRYRGLIRVLGEFRGNFDDPKNGFSSGVDVGGIYYSKILSCKSCLCEFLKKSSRPPLENLEGNKDIVNVISNNFKDIKFLSEEEEEDKEEYNDDVGGEEDQNGDCEVDEDEEMDIEKLRKAFKIERERANTTYLELEKERMAAASAANEAMAMILRLQNEKSSIEMNAHQYHKLAEQKQRYDQEVIQFLHWIISKHESERDILERQLKLCRHSLRHYLEAEDGEEVEDVDHDQTSNHFYSAVEDDFADGLIDSLEIDSSLT